MLCRKHGATAAYTPMLHARLFAEVEKYRAEHFTTTSSAVDRSGDRCNVVLPKTVYRRAVPCSAAARCHRPHIGCSGVGCATDVLLARQTAKVWASSAGVRPRREAQ